MAVFPLDNYPIVSNVTLGVSNVHGLVLALEGRLSLTKHNVDTTGVGSARLAPVSSSSGGGSALMAHRAREHHHRQMRVVSHAIEVPEFEEQIEAVTAAEADADAIAVVVSTPRASGPSVKSLRAVYERASKPVSNVRADEAEVPAASRLPRWGFAIQQSKAGDCYEATKSLAGSELTIVQLPEICRGPLDAACGLQDSISCWGAAPSEVSLPSSDFAAMVGQHLQTRGGLAGSTVVAPLLVGFETHIWCESRRR